MFARRVLRIFPQVTAGEPVARIEKYRDMKSGEMTPTNSVQVADQGSKFAVAPLLLVTSRRAPNMTQVQTLRGRHPQQ